MCAAIVASALALVTADFESFTAGCDKAYNGDEAAARATFEANVLNVKDHKALNMSFEFGENQFSEVILERYHVAAGLGYKALESRQSLPHLDAHVHEVSRIYLSDEGGTGKGKANMQRFEGHDALNLF